MLKLLLGFQQAKKWFVCSLYTLNQRRAENYILSGNLKKYWKILTKCYYLPTKRNTEGGTGSRHPSWRCRNVTLPCFSFFMFIFW